MPTISHNHRAGPICTAAATALVIACLVVSALVSVSCNTKEVRAPTATNTPSRPEAEGRLVFTHSGYLYLLDPNGTHLKKITHGSNDWYPAASPDGKKIAFWSNADKHYNIWTIGSNGSGLKQITKESEDIFDENARRFILGNRPAWGPDSEWLAFASRDKIWRVDVGGFNLSTMASMPNCLSPAIAAIDKKEKSVVFVSDYEARNQNVFNLWKFDIVSETYMQLTDFHDRSAGSPVISANGKEVIFTISQGDHSDIAIVGIDGGDPHNLTKDGRSHSPCVSPNGKKIAFTSQDEDGNYCIHIRSIVHIMFERGHDPEKRDADPEKRDADPEKVANARGAFPSWSRVMSPSDIAALNAYNKKYKSGKPPQPEKGPAAADAKKGARPAATATALPAKAKTVGVKKAAPAKKVRADGFSMPSGPYEVSTELTAIILKPDSEAYFQAGEKPVPEPEHSTPVDESEFVQPKK